MKLREGNVFTGVWLSTRGLPSHNAMGQTPPLLADLPLDRHLLIVTPEYGQQAGGMHPTEMHMFMF